MRFLSPHPGYSVQVFSAIESVENDPVSGRAYTLVRQQPLVANFESGHGLFPHETELALEVFTSVWNGLPENVNPATKIAVYDTEAHKVFNGWSDDFHQSVVDRLVDLSRQNPSRLVAVNERWHAKPWGSYDEMDESQILEFVKVLQIDPESVRLYEGENAQRVGLMEALEALAQGVDPGPLTYTPPAPGSGDPIAVSVGDSVSVEETEESVEDGQVVAVVPA